VDGADVAAAVAEPLVEHVALVEQVVEVVTGERDPDRRGEPAQSVPLEPRRLGRERPPRDAADDVAVAVNLRLDEAGRYATKRHRTVETRRAITEQ
jgi:hypothetical protein